MVRRRRNIHHYGPALNRFRGSGPRALEKHTSGNEVEILDFIATPATVDGNLQVVEDALPSGKYVALAIGPSSVHDVVRVSLPGMDAYLSRGVVLPLPNSHTPTQIKVSTVRMLTGRVQVLGLKSWAAAAAAAASDVRAPIVDEYLLTIPTATVGRIEVPYAGRSTAHFTLVNTDGTYPASMTGATFGRFYRTVGSELGDMDDTWTDVPLNVPVWPAAVEVMAWNESEPQFDSIEWQLTHTEGADVVLWVHTEVRD